VEHDDVTELADYRSVRAVRGSVPESSRPTNRGETMVAERWITDWEPSPKLPVYTRANAGEVLPDPCSPLCWTVVWEPGVNMGWRDSQLSAGTMDDHELHPTRPEVVGLFGGYLYINGSTARLFGARGPGLSPEMIDAVYFGAHPDVPPYVAEPWHDSPSNTAKLGDWMMRVMTAADLPQLRDDRDKANAARASRPDLANCDEATLVKRITSFADLLRDLFHHHLDMTAGTSIGPGALGAIAEALGDPSLSLTLITSIGDVDSAAPSRAMWDLSRLDANSAEYRRKFDEFIDEFGSRGPNEWDIRSDTWETKPELVTVLIDAMRGAADGESPVLRNERNVALREAAEARVREALAGQPEVLGQFDMALRSAHLYLAGRERAKTNIIKVVHEVRMAAFALAARTGYSKSQICMLLADELDAFVAQPDEFRARLAQRERQYLELFELEPPFIVNAVVPSLSTWSRKGASSADPVVAGEVLTGMPGAPGAYTGKARVILDPADPFALEPGEVLIAPFTDPAWTPLFVPAGAVVVNVGAVVSHAIIVSRELGMPCVVSVTDATDRIPDGAVITVDGASGTVTIVSMP
jgi:pyruvate,water dikinase